MYIINKCSGIFLVFISDYNWHRERLHRLWPVFISPSLREVKGGHSLQSANHGLRICMNAAALCRAAPWAKYRPTFTSHNDRSTLTGHGLLASLHRKLSENSKNISDYKKGKWIELLSWFYKFFINPNWHVAGHFYPPCNFGIEFCQLNLYKKFTNFFGGENWQQLD